MEPYFNGYGTPWEVWEGRVGKRVLRSEYEDWLMDFADWKFFVTLTFRDDVAFDVAVRLVHRLVRELNKDLLGRHYSRIVDRSYFSYVIAAEFQQRGAIHFHFLADKPLNFALIHKLWIEWAGFAFTEVIRNKEATVRYSVKYIVKDLKVDINKSDWNGIIIKPHWWLMGERAGSQSDDSWLQGTGVPGEPHA